MYSIFTYIWLIFMVNVCKYSLHGSYGIRIFSTAISKRGQANGSGKRRNPGKSHDDLMWHTWWIFWGNVIPRFFAWNWISNFPVVPCSFRGVYLFNTLVDRRILYHTSISKFTILLNPIRSFKAKEASRSTISYFSFKKLHEIKTQF